MQPKYKKAFIAALALGIISSIHTRPRYPVFPLSILPTVLDVILYFIMISIQIYVLEKVRNSKHSTLIYNSVNIVFVLMILYFLFRSF